jgi:hypothetical protein
MALMDEHAKQNSLLIEMSQRIESLTKEIHSKLH